MWAAIAIPLLIGLIGLASAVSSGALAFPFQWSATSTTLPQLLERVQPSIVLIETASASGERIAQGSGIAIGENLVLTNAHVVHGAAAITVVTAKDRTAEGVEIQNWDLENDIAVIRVNATLNPVTLGDSRRMKVGDRVITIGSPMGLAGSVSEGIMSGRRDIGQLSMIQFTAPISPGSSGGGLFNTRGQLVGITTAQIEGGQNLNLAVPAEIATALLSQTATARIIPAQQRWTRPQRPWFDLLRYSQAVGPVQNIEAERQVTKGNQARKTVAISFDQEGRETSYDYRDTFKEYRRYQYNQQGRLTQVSDETVPIFLVRYNQEGTALHYHPQAPEPTFAENYDESGRLVRMYARTNPKQKLEPRWSCSYGTAGLLSQVTSYYDGAPESIATVTYGRYSAPAEVTEVRSFNNSNNKVTTTFSDYRYDRYGNWFSRQYREVRNYNDYVEEGAEVRKIGYYNH